MARDIAVSIDASLRQEIRLIDSIASDPDIIEASETGDYTTAQIELEAIYRRIGRDFFTFLLTDRNGIVRADAVFAQQIGVSLADRDYFLKAKAGQACVSGPMMPKGTATPGTPIIVVSTPVTDNGEFLGVAAMAFDTNFLMRILSHNKSGQTGLAFLINPDGLVLVHPNSEFNLKLQLLDQPGTEEIAKLLREQGSGTAFFTFQGVDKIVGLHRVELTGWVAAFTQSRREILAPMHKLLAALFITGIIILAATTLFIMVLSGRISRPIDKTLEMMEQVTRHSNDIIVQIGLDRNIVFANPAFEKITGSSPGDVLGRPLDVKTANNVPIEVIWSTLENGAPWLGRIEFQGNKPEAVKLDIMIMPLLDEFGAIQGYLEIGRDITAELMFERRVQQAQKLEAIGTLAGGIAHDFNNILSGIFGYAELALIKTDPNSETGTCVRQILAAAERARELVKQILTFSRKAEVELRPLSPRTIVSEALKLLRASIPATINIESKLESDSNILAEPTQIHQVVMNLFTNALHAIGEHSGTIRVELVDIVVDEEFIKSHPNIKPGNHVQLRISDTGSGIEPFILDHIFEPFFTTKSQGEGTGLGLAVVHGIVNNLGGIITVYSEMGQGTMFNVIIPALAEGEPESAPDNETIRYGTERIIVVDDEAAISATVEAILTSFGYRVTACSDSLEALLAIKADPDKFDLLITDQSMPQITGLEIVRDLREAGLDIPVILFSGFIDQRIEDVARELDISVLLTKPVNTYHLTEAIRKALDVEEG